MTDFVRGIIIEELNHPCQVYSVNGCTDEVRNDENNGERELNIDWSNTNEYLVTIYRFQVTKLVTENNRL
mgnify:CR=1 FL=1